MDVTIIPIDESKQFSNNNIVYKTFMYVHNVYKIPSTLVLRYFSIQLSQREINQCILSPKNKNHDRTIIIQRLRA